MNEEYGNFIESGEWKLKRKQLLSERGLTCEKCGKDFPKRDLEIHHKNYEHEFGTEMGEDLMIVCKNCHRELEQGIEFFNNPEMKNRCPECNKLLINNECKSCGIKIQNAK